VRLSLDTNATCAALIEESRVKLINANKLYRKSGGLWKPAFVCWKGALQVPRLRSG
jgi:hypothetical protein